MGAGLGEPRAVQVLRWTTDNQQGHESFCCDGREILFFSSSPHQDSNWQTLLCGNALSAAAVCARRQLWPSLQYGRPSTSGATRIGRAKGRDSNPVPTLISMLLLYIFLFLFTLSLSPSANSHLLLSPSIVTHKPEVAGHLCACHTNKIWYRRFSALYMANTKCRFSAFWLNQVEKCRFSAFWLGNILASRPFG